MWWQGFGQAPERGKYGQACAGLVEACRSHAHAHTTCTCHMLMHPVPVHAHAQVDSQMERLAINRQIKVDEYEAEKAAAAAAEEE